MSLARWKIAWSVLAVFSVGVLCIIHRCSGEGNACRRTWTARVPIRLQGAAPPNDCLKSILRERFSEVREPADASDRRNDFEHGMYFKSPVSYGERSERWIGSAMDLLDGAPHLEFGDDYYGVSLNPAQSRELSVVLASTVELFLSRCLTNAPETWTVVCETYPKGEPCPLLEPSAAR
jgi:hypothetical protein